MDCVCSIDKPFTRDKKCVHPAESWTLSHVISLAISEKVAIPFEEHIIAHLPYTHRVCVPELAILGDAILEGHGNRKREIDPDVCTTLHAGGGGGDSGLEE